MPTSMLRERIHRGELLVGTFLNTGSSIAVELAGRAGLDWLLIDLEHGAGTEADLLPQLYAAASTSAPALVRVESNARLRLGRALDLGAAGIMVPRLETAAEARDAVSYLRWPPDGVRGVALSTRGAGQGTLKHSDVQGSNELLALVVQVENPTIVDQAPEVAAIDGVDVLFVGPTDLSHSLGIPGRFDDPRYEAALARVVDAARSAGKEAGILIQRPQDLDRVVELGFRFVGIGSDGAFIAAGAAAAVAAGRRLA